MVLKLLGLCRCNALPEANCRVRVILTVVLNDFPATVAWPRRQEVKYLLALGFLSPMIVIVTHNLLYLVLPIKIAVYSERVAVGDLCRSWTPLLVSSLVIIESFERRVCFPVVSVTLSIALVGLEECDCASYGRVVQLHVNVEFAAKFGTTIALHDETSAIDRAVLLTVLIRADIQCHILAAYVGGNFPTLMRCFNGTTSYTEVILDADFF